MSASTQNPEARRTPPGARSGHRDTSARNRLAALSGACMPHEPSSSAIHASAKKKEEQTGQRSWCMGSLIILTSDGTGSCTSLDAVLASAEARSTAARAASVRNMAASSAPSPSLSEPLTCTSSRLCHLLTAPAPLLSVLLACNMRKYSHIPQGLVQVALPLVSEALAAHRICVSLQEQS